VVTLAFWTQRKVHPHDLPGYVGAQLLGAILGTAAVAGLCGGGARAVHLGATEPGRGLTRPAAMLVEAAMTAVLVLVLLLMTSSARTARRTPLVLWAVIAALCGRARPTPAPAPSLAQFEKELIRERTVAGLAAARARGRAGGRPAVWTEDKLRTARTMRASGHYDVTAIAKVLEVSRASVYRALELPLLGATETN